MKAATNTWAGASVEELVKSMEQGYGVGDVADFLGLTPEEDRLVDLGIAVSTAVRNARDTAGLTQAQLGKRIGTSATRVVRIEAGAVGVPLDLAFHALFAMGGTLADVSKELARLRRGKAELRSRLDAAKAIVKKRTAKAARSTSQQAKSTTAASAAPARATTAGS